MWKVKKKHEFKLIKIHILKQQHDSVHSVPRSALIWEWKNAGQWGWHRKKNGLIPVATLEHSAPEIQLNLISCKGKKGCINCSDTCDSSHNPLHDSDGVEETGTVFEQKYDVNENEDRDESENLMADDAEVISICDVSIDTENDELVTPGPSRILKRRCAEFQNSIEIFYS